jgi:transposase
VSVHAASVTSSTVSLAVDVGKSWFACSLTDSARVRLLGPVECSMTGSALRELVARVERVLPAKARVKVGVEAAGHYHLPLLAPATWPAGWEVLEFNPAHVTEQRRVMGRRWLKTDAIDLEAITELLLAGRGAAVTARQSVLGELAAWSAHRTRRVAIRTATMNQLLGHLDRSFPGLTLALPDVLGTRIGRLVAAEFADPARLAALGANRLVRFAAARNLQLRRPLAERLVTAARDALPTADAAVARQVLAADLTLLADLDAQVSAAEAELARLLPVSPFAMLITVPGWGTVRAGKPALEGLTYAVAPSFAIQGLSVQFRAHINREHLRRAVRAAALAPAGGPDLTRRDWARVGRSYAALYDSVVRTGRGHRGEVGPPSARSRAGSARPPRAAIL